MEIKKVILVLYLGVILFISCTPKKKIKQVLHAENMTIPTVSSIADSQIYLCVQYTFVHGRKTNEKLKEACTCHNSLLRLLEWEKNIYSETINFGMNTIIIWDSNFVINYVLPLTREEKYIKKIEYTLANSNDSIFRNIVNFNNKVIVNDKMYYYPIKIKTYISVDRVNYEWFKSIVPQSSWIYKPDCFDDGEGMSVGLLIPLLDKENKRTKSHPKIKKAE
jgi:hypothetical protein